MNIEWESTICVPITRNEFDTLHREMCIWQDRTETRRIQAHYAYKTDTILVFANDVRVAERVVQRKVIDERRYVLGTVDDIVYPIVRTRATETETSLDSVDFMQLNKIVTRIVMPRKQLRDPAARNSMYAVYDSEDEDDEDGVCSSSDDDDNDRHRRHRPMLRKKTYPRIRQSFNEERTDQGVKYTLECEIEYAPNSSYAEILDYENTLMDIMFTYKDKLVADTLSLQKIFSCVVPKVQLWNCFDDSQKFLWAYKYNGVKGKFMCIGENAYIWPDAGEIYTDTCRVVDPNALLLPTITDSSSNSLRNPLDLIRNMCMQVEIMNDSIIIVEVVAISYFNNIHNPEPLVNVELLKYLRKILYRQSGGSHHHQQQQHQIQPNVYIGDKPLLVQTFRCDVLPKSYNTERYDGFIIVQNDLLIKWKCPTLDMRYVGPGNRFTVADNRFITLPDSSFILDRNSNDDQQQQPPQRIEPQLNAIYEVASNLKILRLRTDRCAASTEHEYRVFEKSVKLLNDSVSIVSSTAATAVNNGQ